jgi:pimeloyl-ACP methyl ester carboxylesterase
VTGPERVRLALPSYTAEGLAWGPEGGPLALLLHGFPDTAHTWRHLGPHLAAEGFRAVAPFLRGYAPSGVPTDGDYTLGALMDDAARWHDGVASTGPAVLVGHDWGALAASGLAAASDSPFTKVVTAAVPPVPALSPVGDVRGWGRIAPAQARMSWYVALNQLPWVPERSFDRLVAHLWRQWSPGHDPTEDLALLARSLGRSENRAAALGYYRALRRRPRSESARA